MMSITATATPWRESRAGDWTCWRCGHKHIDGKPNQSGLCESCRLTRTMPQEKGRTRKISSGRDDLEQPCRAWLRDFDEHDHPITPEGTLVAPGERVCGHLDCVEPTHILAEAA